MEDKENNRKAKWWLKKEFDASPIALFSVYGVIVRKETQRGGNWDYSPFALFEPWFGKFV